MTDGELLNSQIRRMNKAGMSDPEISRRLGVCRTAVGTRRRRMLLPFNRQPKGPKFDEKDTTDYELVDRLALAWRLISFGASDAKVADLCDVDLDTAREYRSKMPGFWRDIDGEDLRSFRTYKVRRNRRPNTAHARK